MRINNIFSLLVPKSQAQLEAEAQRAVLRKEAEIGGTVFGPVPNGVRREFFCLDVHTWIWHEEWIDETKQQHVRTTRYDVRPHGIFKAQDGQPYRPLTSDEAVNLYFAVQEYNKAVDAYFIPRLAPSY
jgi:hypothetical protein